MEPFGPRVCTDWITQWQTFDQVRRQKKHRVPVRRHESPEVAARFHFLTPGRVVGFGRSRGIVLRQYRSKGQKSPMVTALRLGGAITESPASTVTEVSDRVLDCEEAPVYPWCTPESVEELLHQLAELPGRLPELPILVPKDDEPIPDAIVQTLGDLPVRPVRRVPPVRETIPSPRDFARNNTDTSNRFKRCEPASGTVFRRRSMSCNSSGISRHGASDRGRRMGQAHPHRPLAAYHRIDSRRSVQRSRSRHAGRRHVEHRP